MPESQQDFAAKLAKAANDADWAARLLDVTRFPDGFTVFVTHGPAEVVDRFTPAGLSVSGADDAALGVAVRTAVLAHLLTEAAVLDTDAEYAAKVARSGQDDGDRLAALQRTRDAGARFRSAWLRSPADRPAPEPAPVSDGPSPYL